MRHFMKRLGALTCISLAVCIVLAATGRLAAQKPQPNTSTTQPSKTFTVLQSFNGSDGANPYASLLAGPGPNLYGTTINGGAYGSGTVFEIGRSRRETVLYSFTGGSDGMWPYAGVIQDNEGNLYGTTHSGGAYGNGTVFKLDSFGNETVLHSFDGSDGSVPLAGLIIDEVGNLYGTTYVGGAYNSGTLFKLDTSGNEMVLYSFSGGSDGGGPYAGSLIRDVMGNLYGTTSSGGGYNLGTIFRYDASGSEVVLHSFNGSDGWAPYGGVVMDEAGNLYGTTGLGGTGCSTGCGTVFRLDTSGNETVLHSFTGLDGDGLIPLAGLIRNRLGNLYGTTAGGGVYGGGIVFELDSSGHETVLHSFPGNDLAYSNGDLLMDGAGNIYGTTFWGGGSGDGIVFKIQTLASAP
jgi:uncharacterized repeat protein (TIGR03803 family)